MALQRLGRCAHHGRRIGQPLQSPRNRSRRREPIPERCQITRPAAPEREPRKRARNIGDAAQPLTQIIGERLVLAKERYAIEPGVNARRGGQRSGDPFGQRPRPGTRHSPVNRGQQRSGARAANRLGQLKVPARRGIDAHMPPAFLAARRRQMRDAPFLCEGNIFDQPAKRGQLSALKCSEPIQRCHAEDFAEPALRMLALKAAPRKRGERRGLFQRRDGFVLGLLKEGFGNDNL